MNKRKIILDCDPGHDDAVAIILAAKNPNLELLGITVVAGNQTLENTQRNALHLVQHLDLNLPVYAGCGQPMVRDKVIAGDIHGETGLDGPVFEELNREIEADHAVNYIIKTLMNSPEKITVVTTGPMTNLGMALRMEPKIVGLDVTRKALCYPQIVERMRKVGNKASDLFTDLMAFFCKTQKEVYGWEGGPLHDPITIAYLIDPTVLITKPMNVTVDTSSSQSYGRTNCDFFGYMKKEPNVNVGIDIDVEKFWDIVEDGLKLYD